MEAIQVLSDTLLQSGDTLTVLLISRDPEKIWVQLLPLIIAGLAVFVGPMIQLYLGKRQMMIQTQIAQEHLRANVRSSNRQQWIHILRDQLSEFASELGGLLYNLDSAGRPISRQIHVDKAERLLFVQTKIQLLLNPDKPDQKKIIDLVDEARQAALARQVVRIEVIMVELIRQSQELMKLTWERIKTLE